MLERATACLKAGAARDSLRSASRSSKTRRLLKSSFWNHGAGDLDLPHWATSPTSFPRRLHFDQGSNSAHFAGVEGVEQRKKCERTSNTTEGIFLDFLYPPQALALLQRYSAHQSQRWERRNARRLADGFIIASRGYASRSRDGGVLDQDNRREEEPTSMPERKEDMWTQDENERENNDDVGARGREPGATAEAEDDLAEFAIDEAPRSAELAHRLEEARGRAQHHSHSFERITGDPTSALEEPSIDFTGDPNYALKYLRQRITSTSALTDHFTLAKSREAVLIAWDAYSALDPATQEDMRLQSEFLAWLVRQDHDVGDELGLNIYSAMPMAARTLPVYNAAVVIHLRNMRFEEALSVHAEALNNLENGHEVSKMLFRYALEHEQWELAYEAQAKHFATYSNTARSNQIAIFWLHVSESPDLFRQSIALSQHLTKLVSSKSATLEFQKFCSAVFKEAVLGEFSANTDAKPASKLAAGVPAKRIRLLFKNIRDMDEDPARVFESTLRGLMHPDAKFDYIDYHYVISYVYKQYRLMAGVTPSEDLLMALLRAVITYAIATERVVSHSHSLSIISLVNDWTTYYGKLRLDAVVQLLTFYARDGNIDRVTQWYAYLRKEFPLYKDQKEALWAPIYLHARRADLDQAQQAFAEAKRIAAEHGEELDLRFWNLLLHAHARADDLEGGLTNLQNLINEAKLKPDAFSFHPIAEMLARRGDVDSLHDLMRQYDELTSKPRKTALYGSLIQAHVRNSNVAEAKTILQDLIPLVKNRTVRGGLVRCCNILLTAYALQRDIDGVMETYRMMRSEEIPLGAGSYAQLMQCLCHLRQPDRAFKILTAVMPRNEVRPTAFHYAVCMTGYNGVSQYDASLRVHDHMRKKNVHGTISSRAAYLVAKAGAENLLRPSYAPDGPAIPLEDTIKDLMDGLRHDAGEEDIAPKDTRYLQGFYSAAEAAPAAYFDSLIRIHGRRRCFEAVRELHRRYMTASKRDKTVEPAPLRIISSLMFAYDQAKDYGKVIECWKLAKELADELTAPIFMPALRSSQSSDQEPVDPLNIKTPNLDARSAPPNTDTQDLLTDTSATRSHAPSEGRKYALARPLRYYLRALHELEQVEDEINTFVGLLQQGYVFDSRTWNVFIRHLCQQPRPLALLAFVLTERYLISNFPGWSHKRVRFPPRPSEVILGRQHMRSESIVRGALVPEYYTMVWLASANLKLRQAETFGEQGPDPNLERYVGTTRALRQEAPRALYAAQTMPRVQDRIQVEVLRIEDEEWGGVYSAL